MLKKYTKQELLDALLPVIQMTRGGSEVMALELVDEETVKIVFPGGSHYANIAGDSGMAIIRDVCKKVD